MPKNKNKSRNSARRRDGLQSSSPEIYAWPGSKRVEIDASQLTIQLTKFKKAVETIVGWPTLIALLALWAPALTADFKGFAGLDKGFVAGGYYVLAIVATAALLWPLLVSCAVEICRAVPYCKKHFADFIDNHETDPERKTNYIIRNCKPK